MIRHKVVLEELVKEMNELIEQGIIGIEELYSDSIAVYTVREMRKKPNYRLYVKEEKEILPSKLPLLSKKFDYQSTAEESELKIDTTYFDIGSLEDLEKKEEKKK